MGELLVNTRDDPPEGAIATLDIPRPGKHPCRIEWLGWSINGADSRGRRITSYVEAEVASGGVATS
jgi:hypothetical protein